MRRKKTAHALEYRASWGKCWALAALFFDGHGVVVILTADAHLHAAITAKDREIAKLEALLKQTGTRIPPGHPVAATETQQLEVKKLRKAGLSLRKIARATNLGLSTVVTILKTPAR